VVNVEEVLRCGRQSRGRAIAVLVEHELRSVVGESDAEPVFLDEFENGLAERQRSLDARERGLMERERWLGESDRRVRTACVSLPPSADIARVGRNDPCSCGSGLKHKRCHGA
jgi:hypothetical protein